MFTIPEIVLLGLKIVNAIMTEVHDTKAYQAGTDAEIAKVSAAILRKTQAGKAIMEKVDAMDDKDVDAGLRGLEP
jgi:uncharacterized protein YjbI with pentapeptide repeats